MPTKLKRSRPIPIKKKGAVTMKTVRKAVKKVASSRRGVKARRS